MTRVAHILTAALCFCTLLLSAQTTWTGTTNSNWSTASNWSNGIPAAGNDAAIPVAGTPTLTLTANTVFDYGISNQGNFTIDLAGFNLSNNGLLLNNSNISVSGNGTFSNLNILTNNSSFTSNSIFTNSFSGTLNNAGTMNLNNTTINFSALENTGALVINADFDNGGTVNNRTGAMLTNNANFDNINGNVILNEGEIINALNWSNFGEINNSGTLRNQSIFLNDGGGVINNLSTGTTLNEGRFTNQNNINNAGIFENTSCNTFTGQNGSSTINTGAGTFSNNGILYQLGTAVVDISDGTGVIFTDLNEFPAPDMVCFSDKTIDLGADGTYNLTLNEIDSSSTVGYCNVASRILSQSIFTCADVGDQAIVLTITDGLGTSNNCQTIVTVRDNTPPTLSCPSDISINLGQGDCNEPVVYSVTGSDNCSSIPIQIDNSGFTSGDAFPAGETVLEYKIQDNNFAVNCVFSVTVSGLTTGGALSCNNQLNVSLDENCNYTFTPNIILSGAQVCDDIYSITINDIAQTTVDETFIGQNLMVSVINNMTGNSCWGNALIEDKLAPQITNCTDATINCFQNSAPISEGGLITEPIFNDCSEFTTFYIDALTQGTCADTFSQIINRTWTAVDIFGRSNTCQQTITVIRVTLTNGTIACPSDFIGECVAGTAPDISPETTGYPTITIDGVTYSLNENTSDNCGLATTFSDSEFDMCNGSRKVMRTWSVFDWCLPMNPSTNPFTCTQIVEITDNTAPEITTPADFTVSVDENCAATFVIPPATFVDCSTEINWQTTYSSGTLNSNGGTIPAPGLSIGTTIITYIATDACGNTSTAELTVTIIDDIVPVAICHHDIMVVLSSGMGQLNATSIDNGSTDNCCLETILIARMDDNCGNPDDLIFGESVTFCCADVGLENLVSLEVTDCYGNQNSCMVPVVVADNEMPSIVCPSDITLECDANSNDLQVTGTATGVDDCGETTVTFEDMGTITCEGGMLVRTFTASDNFNNPATCIQTITIVAPDLLTQNDIICPADYNAVGCTPNTDPTTTGTPIINAPNCVETTLDYTDVTLPGTGQYCMKITRTWVITDVCIFDGNPNNGGYFECVQSILVGSSDAPDVVCPSTNPEFCSGANTCEAENLNLSISASDDCTPTEDLLIFWTVDINNDGVADSGVEASGIGMNVGNTYPVGSHEIIYTVKDGCGNAVTCTFIFTVNDCNPPTVICPNGIVIELAQDAEITLNANQIMTGSATNICAQSNNFINSFSTNTSDNTRTFSCSDVGPAFEITLYVSNSAGNQTTCTTTIEVQDNMSVCPQSLMISGAVATEAGLMVEEVPVEIMGSEMTETMTDNVGHYEYVDGSFGQNYALTPHSGDDYLNGITTWDIIPIRRHILNTEPITSPYKLIAADVNNSGTITTADVIILRSLILQLITEFPENNSWRYVDADYQFPDVSNPWLEGFPEAVSLTELSNNTLQNNFIAVKIGDMNETASTNGIINSEVEERSGDNFNLRISDQDLVADEEITVEIFPEDLEKIYAYQMTFEFDTDALEFISLQQGEGHQRANFGLRLLDDGAITCSWDKTLLDASNNNNGSLFSVKFRTRNAAVLSKVLNVSSRFTQATAYTENGEPMNIQLNFTDKNGINNAADNFTLYQNRPNPFRETTHIGFNLPTASEVTLKVFDVSGKLLKRITQNADDGYNEIILSAGDLPTRGMLYYELTTPTQQATRKMLVSY